ncbi:MAG: CDP-alcohol phosphatidyltransferase family protein [Alphaproteobacteria bacterium]
MISVPNFISLGRLLCVPLTVWLILIGEMALAFWVFVGAGVSDAVDGFIAKRFNARTELGRYIDPLADKALLMSVYVTLGSRGDVANWLVILVVFRDLMIIGGTLLYHTLTDQPMRMEPLMVSKLNTLLQIALVVLVLGRLGLGIDDAGVTLPLTYVVAFTTFVSGAAYLVRWVRGISGVGEA